MGLVMLESMRQALQKEANSRQVVSAYTAAGPSRWWLGLDAMILKATGRIEAEGLRDVPPPSTGSGRSAAVRASATSDRVRVSC